MSLLKQNSIKPVNLLKIVLKPEFLKTSRPMKNVALATTEGADKEIRFWNLLEHGLARLVTAKTFSIAQENAMSG